MPTEKKRLNLSLPDTLDRVLTKVAARDRVPAATKAVELLQIALEQEEDVVWSRLAGLRDKRGAHFVSHHDAWI